MRQRKAKPRKEIKMTVNINAKIASEEDLERILRLAVEQSKAAARKERNAKQREFKKSFPQGKCVKRNLSQIELVHWWKDRAFIQRLTKNEIPIEEQKAAVWYEAVRRRPEVKKAWLEGKCFGGDNSWQHFTGYVLTTMPLPWPKLDPITKNRIMEASYSPLSVPPEGYSTFPTTKALQRKVSMQVLRLPESNNNDTNTAAQFIEQARRFAEAGFLIVAVDKKQNQAVRAAFEAIQALPPTFRKADLKRRVFHHFPPQISDADSKTLKDKHSKGALTHKDLCEIWLKYNKPSNALYAPWHQTAEVQERVIHKRLRQGKPIEERKFNFETICRQIEAHDAGKPSDFVRAVRL